MKRTFRGSLAGALVALLVAGTAVAQSVPPSENGVEVVIISTSIPGQVLLAGADAFAPILPAAPEGVFAVLPEQIISEIQDVPLTTVTFDYFGPRAVVLQLLAPQTMILERPLPVLSNASQTDSVQFGVKPAGSQVIVFFLREGFAYILDLSTNNYAWIPFKSEDVQRAP